MGRCCFGKIALLLGIFVAFPVMARCPLADKYAKEGNKELEVMLLGMCATSYNDDDSQMRIANGSISGTDGFKKDEEMALYMYQLAAESGNAEAQVKLAELLQSFDTSSERRKQLKEYQKKLKKSSQEEGGFAGEIQHPYTLLLLASERPENKWYYPSTKRVAPAKTSVLLKNYKITNERRQAAMKDASRWKTRKLLEMAREILSEGEYEDFEQRLKNNVTRTQAMEELKALMTGYVDAKKKERALPL